MNRTLLHLFLLALNAQRLHIFILLFYKRNFGSQDLPSFVQFECPQ